jgi:heme/copper-type cytochrome/quinol oxidase subunit 2
MPIHHIPKVGRFWGWSCVLFVVCLSPCACRRAVKTVDSLTIEMTGEDFRWSSRYPGADGEIGTCDDFYVAQKLTVPKDARIEIQLKSNDFIYSLEVPHKDLAEIAVPDMTFSLRFDADRLGAVSLPGEQLCGYAHPDLMATLLVVSQSDFDAWQREAKKNGIQLVSEE